MNVHGTGVGSSRANQENCSRPAAISTARPICHRFDYNYRAFVDNGAAATAFRKAGVKQLTDSMGGIKFYLGSNFGGNPFGYPDYRLCLSSSPTHFVELSKIPTTNVWTPFWKEMVRAQETGDNNSGWLYVGTFVSFVNAVIAVVYFSNVLVTSLVLLYFVVALCCCVSDTHTQWRRVIDNHQPKFEAVGYRVELLIEITGPPNHKSVSPKCYVCRIWEGNSTATSQHETSLPPDSANLV